MSTQRTTVVVLHPEAICAEAIAIALARYPGVSPIGISNTAAGGQRLVERADAVVIHERVTRASAWARRFGAAGARVVMIANETATEAPGAHVLMAPSMDDLASALRPGTGLPEERLPELTHRERQVLTLVAGGLAGKQVARELGISPKTVERHKTRIYSKLGVPNQAAAAGIAAIDSYTNGGFAWSQSNT